MRFAFGSRFPPFGWESGLKIWNISVWLNSFPTDWVLHWQQPGGDGNSRVHREMMLR
jgi:hypothetical protein